MHISHDNVQGIDSTTLSIRYMYMYTEFKIQNNQFKQRVSNTNYKFPKLETPHLL